MAHDGLPQRLDTVLQVALHDGFRRAHERALVRIVVLAVQRFAQQVHAVQLVEDIQAGQVLARAVVLLQLHRVLVVLIDGFPLCLGDADGAAYRRCACHFWASSGGRMHSGGGGGAEENEPSVI